MSDKTTADDQTATIEAARKEAAADAIKADRERRAAIMALDEANGREALATFYADETEDDIERVKKALAAAPKAAEEKAPDPKAEYDEGRTTATGAGLGGPPPPQKGKAQTEAVRAAIEKTNQRRAR